MYGHLILGIIGCKKHSLAIHTNYTLIRSGGSHVLFAVVFLEKMADLKMSLFSFDCYLPSEENKGKLKV